MLQRVIIELFNLSNEESLFDDFNCEYDKKQGKIYIMENHLGFHSDSPLTKLLFKLKDVEKIEKDETSIKIKVGTQVYTFCKIENTESAYKSIEAPWIICCPEKANNVEGEKKIKNVKTNIDIEEEIKDIPMIQPNTIYVELDDPQAIKISFEKYQKREHEHLRYVFGFTVEEHYKRFLADECPYADVKNLEIMGSYDFKTKGWEEVQGTPGKKTRTLTLQYKLAKPVLVSTAYTIKDSKLEYFK